MQRCWEKDPAERINFEEIEVTLMRIETMIKSMSRV